MEKRYTTLLAPFKLLGSRMNPARFFLITGLVWGSIMVVYLPMFQVPDEPAHSLRAWQLSVPQSTLEVRDNRIGSELPVILREVMFKVNGTKPYINQGGYGAARDQLLNTPLDERQTAFLFHPNTAMYLPVAYLPQAAGIGLGRSMGLPGLVILLLGRYVNLVFWLGMVYTAIRLMPRSYQWPLVFLALWPMSVHQAASLSADAVVNGLAFLWIGLVFRIAYVPDIRLRIRDIALLTLLAALLCLAKNVYAPLVGLFLLVPMRKATRPGAYWTALFLIAVVSLVGLLCSAHHVRHLLDQLDHVEHIFGTTDEVPHINPDKQTAIVLADVPAFLDIVWRSFSQLRGFVATTLIGVYCWLNVPMPAWYYWIAAFFVLWSLFSDHSTAQRMILPHRALLLISSLCVLLFFSFVMYLSWCEPGANLIGNLQGRYFIPITPLLLFGLRTTLLRLPSWFVPYPYMAFAVLSGLVAIRELWYAFYYPGLY